MAIFQNNNIYLFIYLLGLISLKVVGARNYPRSSFSQRAFSMTRTHAEGFDLESSALGMFSYFAILLSYHQPQPARCNLPSH